MFDSYSVALRDQRILVVEDSYFVGQELMEALERHGADVVGPVSTIYDALRLADEERKFDAAVLDMNLRGEMIWPVADLLSGRNVKLVFVTGYDGSLLKKRYRLSSIIQKPTPARAVVRLLASHITPTTQSLPYLPD